VHNQEASSDLEMALYRRQLRQDLARLIERIDSHLQALRRLDPDDVGDLGSRPAAPAPDAMTQP